MDDAVELLLVNDDAKRAFLELADRIDRLFRAMLPDSAADQFGPTRATFAALASKIRLLTPAANIDVVMGEVNQLLDRSIAPEEGYIISAPVLDQLAEMHGEYNAEHMVDLSTIDFKALAALFEQGKKHTATEKLRGQINAKLGRMIRLNRVRSPQCSSTSTITILAPAGAPTRAA